MLTFDARAVETMKWRLNSRPKSAATPVRKGEGVGESAARGEVEVRERSAYGLDERVKG